MPRVWHLITGEYPPDRGGVADYTQILATALVERGDEVHVWTRSCDEPFTVEYPGVVVHRLAGRFSPFDLLHLNRELERYPHPRTLVIQYTPHAFGWKAMNLAFAVWVLARRLFHRDDVRVMFHEVAFPWVRTPMKHNMIAAVNRIMATLLARAATRAYVSTMAWLPLLKRLGGPRFTATWTPVPSTIPVVFDPVRVAQRRAELTAHEPLVLLVGHFGTYGPTVTRTLEPLLRLILSRYPHVRIVLLGTGSDLWRNRTFPDSPTRLIATGARSANELSVELQACDLVVQPYPDGVTTRRTTVMAALANGVPVVTNRGRDSEAIWAGGIVAAAPVEDVQGLCAVLVDLLNDASRRADCAKSGQLFYESRFAVGHTVEILHRFS